MGACLGRQRWAGHLEKENFLLIHVQCGAVPLAPVTAGVLVSGSGVGAGLDAVVGVLYIILHPQVQSRSAPWVL